MGILSRCGSTAFRSRWSIFRGTLVRFFGRRGSGVRQPELLPLFLGLRAARRRRGSYSGVWLRNSVEHATVDRCPSSGCAGQGSGAMVPCWRPSVGARLYGMPSPVHGFAPVPRRASACAWDRTGPWPPPASSGWRRAAPRRPEGPPVAWAGPHAGPSACGPWPSPGPGRYAAGRGATPARTPPGRRGGGPAGCRWGWTGRWTAPGVMTEAPLAARSSRSINRSRRERPGRSSAKTSTWPGLPLWAAAFSASSAGRCTLAPLPSVPMPHACGNLVRAMARRSNPPPPQSQPPPLPPHVAVVRLRELVARLRREAAKNSF